MTPDAVLEDYRGWLRRTAASLINDTQLQQDLAQEGWIAMWRALRAYQPDKGALPSWLTRHAMWRMCDCARDKTWLGRPPRHQGRTKVRDTVEYPVAADTAVWDLLGAVHLTDGVMLAYHHGEITDAINRLSPQQRRYVYLRFWCGYQLPDLTRVFGYDPSGLWGSPKNGAKHKLRADLHHLVAA